jgi:predicted phosphodiesterase
VRYAVVADVHGSRDHLAAVLAAASGHGAAEVVIAGDYLECLISKRAMATAAPAGISAVVAEDRPYWDLLTRCTLVRGNQEERIAVLTAGLPVGDALAGLLAAPATVVVSGLRVMHGHTFDWSKAGGWWVPTLDDAVPADPVVVFGHSHQALLTTLGEDGEYRPRQVEFGRPVPLVPGVRYLINLAPLCDSPPGWLLYDDVSEVVTFHEAAI